ncbi:MAG: DUF192 domain-containing protein [bacterium]|nr:DUF192 domain-containing protein [bacterium]
MKLKLRTISLFKILVLLVIAGFLFYHFLPKAEYIKPSNALLTINNQTFLVELAKIDQERMQGLSGRKNLGENEGMLFLFPAPFRYSFWMKDMNFNLDFIFMNNNEVVDLAENIPFPKNGEQPEVVMAKKDFDKVLEVNTGVIAKANIKIGDMVDLTQADGEEKKISN